MQLTLEEHAVQLTGADMLGVCSEAPVLHWEWKELI